MPDISAAAQGHGSAQPGMEPYPARWGRGGTTLTRSRQDVQPNPCFEHRMKHECHAEGSGGGATLPLRRHAAGGLHVPAWKHHRNRREGWANFEFEGVRRKAAAGLPHHRPCSGFSWISHQYYTERAYFHTCMAERGDGWAVRRNQILRPGRFLREGRRSVFAARLSSLTASSAPHWPSGLHPLLLHHPFACAHVEHGPPHAWTGEDAANVAQGPSLDEG